VSKISTSILAITAALVVALYLYFLPTAIADQRHHREYAPIFVLNLLLGWTFVGWVAALVWSLTSDVEPLLPKPSDDELRTAAWIGDWEAGLDVLRLDLAARGVYLASKELWPYLEQRGVTIEVVTDLAQLRTLQQRIAPHPLTLAQTWAKSLGWAGYRLVWHERAVALRQGWHALLARVAGRARDPDAKPPQGPGGGIARP
jgi:hypothetical protein